MTRRNEKQKLIIILLIIIFLAVTISMVILIFYNSNSVPKILGNSTKTTNTICNLKGDASQKIVINSADINRDKLGIDTLKKIVANDRQRSIDKKEIFRDITSFDYDFIRNCEDENYYQASSDSKAEFDEIYNFNILNENLIGSQFENLKAKFAKIELHPNWEYPDNTIAPLYVDIDWNAILELFSNNFNSNISESELKKQILGFFNIFFKFYGEENVLKLLFTLTTISRNIGETVAVTSTWPMLKMTFMSFGQKIPDIKREYAKGYWSSNKESTVLIHEYGHALDFFLTSSKSNWKQYNLFSRFNQPGQLDLIKKYLNDQEYLKVWNKKYNNLSSNNLNSGWLIEDDLGVDASKLLIDFLANEAKVENPQQKYLLAWSIVNSNYGRIEGRSELFSEAFSQWIAFPRQQKTKSWELLHKFFSKYLPSRANI